MGRAHLRDLALGNRALKKHRNGDEPLATVYDLIGPGIESQTFRAGVFDHYAAREWDKYKCIDTIRSGSHD